MAYINGQHIPFVFSNTGGGGSAHRVNYYEEITEEQKLIEIGYLQGLIDSAVNFSIEVVLGSSIYPAAYTLYDGVIDIYFVSEDGNGFYFIHCAPAVNELVYSFQKWCHLSYNEQTLTDEEKARARENIYVYSVDEVDEYANMLLDQTRGTVKYNTTQTLSVAEKAKARENIGALGSGDITGLPDVTTADAGKFLRVDSNGAWAAVAVGTAEETSF